MKNKENLEFKFNIRTDLALESHELLKERSKDKNIEIDGVKTFVEESNIEDVIIKRIEILNKSGEEKMGKPKGTYITVESPSMKESDINAHEEIIKLLSKNLERLYKLDKDSVALIVGLGNWNVTPDALGPKVVSKVLVTRYISATIPEELSNMVRPVSAISPGVMGITGIETSEIVKGIVDRIKPDIIIAIDALASRSTSRINTTIQITNTGIAPGGGMGNKRSVIDEKTMGVPVIAIGVPTVVDAATLVNDTLDKMLLDMINSVEKGTEFYTMLKDLSDDEKYTLIKDVLDPYTGNMFVTPKEVDAVIERLSNIIANAINISLHPGITKEDINRYMY